jgi:DNA polymerase III delta subunit
MVVVRNCQELKNDVKDFLLSFATKEPHEGLVLVLEAERGMARDDFLEGLKKNCRTLYFKEERQLTVFDLVRAMEAGSAQESLGILNRLLSDGEKPERLLGGLRAAWQKSAASRADLVRRLKLLLECDLDIKTGRLKPALVLERLVIRLCCGRRKPVR